MRTALALCCLLLMYGVAPLPALALGSGTRPGITDTLKSVVRSVTGGNGGNEGIKKLIYPLGIAMAIQWAQETFTKPSPTAAQQPMNFDFTAQPTRSVMTNLLSLFNGGAGSGDLASPDIPRTNQFKTIKDVVGGDNGGALTRFPIAAAQSTAQQPQPGAAAAQLAALHPNAQQLIQSLLQTNSVNGLSIPGLNQPSNLPPATNAVQLSLESSEDSSAIDGGLLNKLNTAAKAMGMGSLNDVPLDGITKIVLDNINNVAHFQPKNNPSFPGMQFEMEVRHDNSKPQPVPTMTHNVFDDAYSRSMLSALKKGELATLPSKTVGVPFVDLPGQN